MTLAAGPLEDIAFGCACRHVEKPLIVYLITFSPPSGTRIIPPHHEVLDIGPTNHVENSEYIRAAIRPSIDVRVDETFWSPPNRQRAIT